jgi:hypothetical protein
MLVLVGTPIWQTQITSTVFVVIFELLTHVRQDTTKASLVRILYRMYMREMRVAWGFILFYSVVCLLSPAYFMQELVRYSSGSYTLGYGLFLAFGIMLRCGCP